MKRHNPTILALLSFSFLSLFWMGWVGAEETVYFPRRDAVLMHPDAALLEHLAQREIPFEPRAGREGELLLWVTPSEFESLSAEGWEIRWVPEEDLVHWEQPKGAPGEFPLPAVQYPTYEQLTAFLQGMAATYPDLCRLESIGESVQGRDLWFLKITDHPDLEEDEPEFKYISSMHGNESLGVPQCSI